MNATKIEWTDLTWNPVTGCYGPHGDGARCSYCYANRLAHGRLRPLYLANEFVLKGNPLNPFAPRYWPDRLEDPLHLKTPAKIFVCSQADLFGGWVPGIMHELIMDIVRRCPQHTFQFLTKWPQNLARHNPWPTNAWVGATATNNEEALYAGEQLAAVDAPIRFLSIEPLLGPIDYPGLRGLDWLIIGAMTGPKAVLPEHEWVAQIVLAADRLEIPVFLKKNLAPVWPDSPCWGPLQNWPDGSDARG